MSKANVNIRLNAAQALFHAGPWHWHFGWWNRPFGVLSPADGETITNMQSWRIGPFGLTRWRFETGPITHLTGALRKLDRR